MIVCKEDKKTIGEIELCEINTSSGEALISIAIGEKSHWGRGYGAEALTLMMDFAFIELHLHHISMTVFGYNTQAIHLYQKTGFVYEGCERQYLWRDERYWDLIYMGILRNEWQTNKK